MAEEKTEDKTEKQEPKAEKKKSPLMLIIIIIIAGLTIGGGGAVSFLLFKGKGKAGPEKTEEHKKEADKHGKEADKHGKKAGKGDEAAGMKTLEPSFIVNLAGGGHNFLKVDITLELTDMAVESEIDSKLPKIKDAILLILSEQTPESIADNKGKLRLKDELLKRLNSYLTAGKVANVYFTSFVVQ